ncbi:helix-turn-helix domain-containing protein [Dokdonia sp. LLG6352-1]|uniref:helix-turn-helix domain-containing protein n=1 Tax=Dokdonia sp. LLG6352-1 TaxID=3160831 RepID=UPI00386A48AE
MIKLIILSIAIFQGVLMSLILLFSPFFKSRANKFLAFAILSLSWSLLKITLDITEVVAVYPLLVVLENIDTEALLPVFIYLFIAAQVDNAPVNPKKVYWLFIPALASTLVFNFVEFTMSGEFTSEIYVFDILGGLLVLCMFIVFIIFYPLILIKTYKVIQYAKDKNEKKWLTYLWYFEVAILGLLMLLVIISTAIESDVINALQTLALLSTILIHWVAYSGIYKLKLVNDRKKINRLFFSQVSNDASPLPNKMVTPIKTEDIKTQTTITADNIYFQKLEKLCTVDKIYRDHTLDRNAVAALLNISPSYVSQIVNAITGYNFSTYINRYRVAEIKKIIVNEEFQNYSLLAIGLECGFSSKTTFHNSFKKITGMTPNAYRKLHK